jgi:hypothetical protein
MRPTKRTKVHRIKPEISKLKKLKERINGVHVHRTDDTGNLKSDKNWVIEEIHNLKNGGWLTAVKMKVANEMWRTYGG